MKTKVKNKRFKKYILLLLLILSIVIGYALLTQKLTIGGSLKYEIIKWNVGFTTAINGNGSVSSNPKISEDKKSITITCELGTSTASETCIVKTTIKNASSFDVMLNETPKIEYDDTYIKSIDINWTSDNTNIKINDEITSGAEKEAQITITTNELTNNILPTSELTIPVTITTNWVEK